MRLHSQLRLNLDLKSKIKLTEAEILNLTCAESSDAPFKFEKEYK